LVIGINGQTQKCVETDSDEWDANTSSEGESSEWSVEMPSRVIPREAEKQTRTSGCQKYFDWGENNQPEGRSTQTRKYTRKNIFVENERVMRVKPSSMK